MRRLLLIALGVLLPILGAHAQPATVFAAASLTDAMRAVAMAWVKHGHPAPALSFASSSTLARQIEAGAPANIFASADEKWMNYLADRHAIIADTRKDVLSNRLVLVVPASNPAQLIIAPGFDLAALLGSNGRLAVGDPAHVPAGIYAKQALTKLGLWGAAAPRLAPAEDVRAALLLVERGEAAAGIVYATDANATGSVRVAGVFPADSHDPIRYPFAIVRGGDTPEARALLAFIEGPEGLALLAKSGFGTE